MIVLQKRSISNASRKDIHGITRKYQPHNTRSKIPWVKLRQLIELLLRYLVLKEGKFDVTGQKVDGMLNTFMHVKVKYGSYVMLL